MVSLIADNCSTHQYIARKFKLSLVRRASNIYQLAIQEVTSNYQGVVEAWQRLIKMLRISSMRAHFCLKLTRRAS